MRRRSREINIFSISALDLFASAMGAFILVAVVLFPYYRQTTQTPIEIPEIEVVFVIDTTESMGAAIDQLKSELVGIAAVLEHIAPDVRIGFVAYKARHRVNEYEIRSFELTSTRDGGLARMQQWVNGLSPQGGGDEIMADAMERAAGMNWGEGAVQVIVLIADEPGEQGSLPGAVAAARRFGGRGERIRVSTFLSPEALDPRYTPRQVAMLRRQRQIAREWLRAIAEAGGGVFVLPDEGGVSSVTLLSVLERRDRRQP